MPKSRGKSAGEKSSETDSPQSSVPALPTITRAQANELLKQRAQELFHEAQLRRDDRIQLFEKEFGRVDRIDEALLFAVRNLQMRFAAIAVRQHSHCGGSEPKVSKFTKQLGDIVGELSAHLATERALDLFTPVEQHEYIGYAGGVGRKGLDESVLAGYTIIEPEATSISPTVVDGEEVCLHEELEDIEDDASHLICAHCEAVFERSASEMPKIDAASENS